MLHEMTSVKPKDTRATLVRESAELFRRRGYAGTGLKAILAASDAPFGSLYHFFPGGKEELGVAALEAGGTTYRELVEAIFADDVDVATATRTFFAGRRSRARGDRLRRRVPDRDHCARGGEHERADARRRV